MDTPHEQTTPSDAGAASASPHPKADAGSPLQVYKPGQGQRVRVASAVGGGIIGLALAWFIHDQLVYTDPITQKAIALAVFVGIGVLLYYMLGRHHGTIDFMIATEGEMRKVNWSTRKEIIGATRVVIVAILALGTLLFLVDIFFMVLFSSIDVLQIDLSKVFGGGE